MFLGPFLTPSKFSAHTAKCIQKKKRRQENDQAKRFSRRTGIEREKVYSRSNPGDGGKRKKKKKGELFDKFFVHTCKKHVHV